MVGLITLMRTFARTLAFALCMALTVIPMAATPIATGSAGPELFNVNADFQVVTNHGGEVDAGLTTFLNTGAVAGNPSTVVISSTPYSMTLTNLLAPGNNIDAATLTLDFATLFTPGATSLYSCVGTGCANYVAPTIQSTGSTVITVVSTSGTTFTWNYQVTSSPVTLNLLTANPDFATDLAGGEDLSVSWTQTVAMSGSYNPPTGGAKCRDCTLVFRTPVSGSSTVSGTIDANVTETPDPPNPVPEPSTGILLGLGIMATAATLRSKILPR